MSALGRAKFQAGLTEHHVLYRRSEWGHGYQRRLQDHPALKPLLKENVHQDLHNQMRLKGMDGVPVVPRTWVPDMLAQLRSEQTLDSISRLQLCLGNKAVVGAQNPEYGDLYVDLANTAIEFLGIQRELIRGEIYVPRVMYQKG